MVSYLGDVLVRVARIRRAGSSNRRPANWVRQFDPHSSEFS
jgi:hypothetical protein